MRLGLYLLVILLLASRGTVFAKDTALKTAWTYYLRGDYRDAIVTCRTISDSRLLKDEGRYIMGLSFLNLGNPGEARKNFEFVLENYPDTQRREELLLGIADAYFIEERFDAAEGYYIELLKGFIGTPYASIAYLHMGECQRRQAKWEESKRSFRKVTRDFPTSLEYNKAKELLEEGSSSFTIQVGAFSKKRNASTLMRKLKAKGYDSYIERKYAKDKLLYCVKIGKFDTKRRAEAEAVMLKRNGFNPRITT